MPSLDYVLRNKPFSNWITYRDPQYYMIMTDQGETIAKKLKPFE